VFVVADGLGGHAGGEEASRIAVEVLKTFCPLPMEEGDRGFLEAVQSGHLRIQEEARRRPELRGMGTTLVAAHVRNRRCVVLHVGDSRGYLIREETLQRITRDHTLVEEMIRSGELPPEAIYDHPDRHILSRALGVEEALRLDRSPFALKDGDLILLCSDGLTNMLPDETIRREILSIGIGDPSAVAQGLIDRANERGGIDNITVVVVRAEAVGKKELS